MSDLNEMAEELKHTKCGTPECCGQCPTASYGSELPSLNHDWYLIAINPWHKWYHNHKTGENKYIRYNNTRSRNESTDIT